MSRLYRSSGGALSPSPSPSATPTPLQTAAAASAGGRANRSATPGSLFGGESVDDDGEWGGRRSVYGSSGSGRNSAASVQQRRGHTPAAAGASSTAAATAAAASAASAPSPAAVAAAASASLAALAAPSPLLLRNTTAADRRLMAHRARVTLARLQAQADGTAPRPGEPFRWNSPFVKKEKRLKMMLISHPSVYPVLSRHLAAWMIQRWWRRLPPAARQKRSEARRAAAAAQGQQWVHPYTAWARTAARGSQRPWRPSGMASGTRGKHISASYFLETGSYHTSLGSKVPTRAYRSWCAAKIARNWLFHRKSKRYREFAVRDLYSYAAIDIQRVWREHKRRQLARQDPSLALHAPAAVIQRAYRRFTQRRIFQYFRSLILARQSSNPYLLLKLLDPREGAQLHDHSSGLYIRFRLGGAVFPPILYYKTFTNFAVTDINSFAPRDYARDRKAAREAVHVTEGGGGGGEEAPHPSALGPTDRSFWYRRYENNGWRPIVHDALLAERDPVLERTAAKTVPFHPSKIVRQLDVLRKRKGKKIEWLRKLYTSGVVALPTQEQLAERQGLQQPATQAEGDGDGGGSYDSDEEEWRQWKSASAARLPGAGTGSGAAGAGGPTPEQMLANLMALDTTSPALLLGGSGSGSGTGGVGDGGGGGDWESEADQLLEWCSGLGDFESYSDAWLVAATSRPNDPAYRQVEHVAPGRAPPPALPQAQAQPQQGSRPGSEKGASAAASPHPRKPSSARRSPAPPQPQQPPPQQQQQQYGSASDVPVGLVSIDEGAALDAQLHAAALLDEDENAELPAWIQQTASRAQLASAQASQASLLATQMHSHSQSQSQGRLGSGRNSRDRLSATPSTTQLFEATQPVQHVHLTAAVAAGTAMRAPANSTLKRPTTLSSTHSSLARLQQHG